MSPIWCRRIIELKNGITAAIGGEQRAKRYVDPGHTPGGAHDKAFDDIGAADELRCESGARAIVERVRRADLDDAALLEHRDAVGHRQRLGVIMRNVDRGHFETSL